MGPRSLPFRDEVFHWVLEGGQEHLGVLAQRAQLPGPMQGCGPSSLDVSHRDGQTPLESQAPAQPKGVAKWTCGWTLGSE